MLTPGGICKIVGILLIVTAPLFQLWEFFCLFYFYLIFLDVLLHTGVWKPFFLPVKEKKKKDENLMGKKVSKLQLRDSKVNIYYFCII